MKFHSTPLKFFLFFLILFTAGCQNKSNNNLIAYSGFTMGTTYHIKIINDNNQITARENFQNRIDSLLKLVNNEMSTYIDSSEISKFNKYEKNKWFSISDDFYNVLKVALMICEGTKGAYDITVGPLVNLWGFGPSKKINKIPAQTKIDSLKKMVGYKKLEIRSNPKSIKKSIDGLYLDLSSIAKGFGVDKVSEFLSDNNIKNFMVEIGGEVRTAGHNQDGGVWEIGISSPDGSNGIAKIIPLSGMAMATSGSYNNYFEVNGKKYSHTIDPRTGWPVKHNLVSVSVLSNSCTLADGLATAIDVLGPVEGYNFALKEEIPILIFINENGKFVEKATPSFKKIINIK